MAEISLVDQSPIIHKRKYRWLSVKENLTGYLFVLPATFIILMFGIFPIGYGLYMSSYNWQSIKGAFILFGNYTRAIGNWWGALIFLMGIAILALAY
jgi:ABC-type sugar transport system permease subunit